MSKHKLHHCCILFCHHFAHNTQTSHSSASSAFSPLVYRAGICGDFQLLHVNQFCRLRQ